MRLEAASTGRRKPDAGVNAKVRVASGILLGAFLILMIASLSARLPTAPRAAGTLSANAGLHPVINAGGCTFAPNASEPTSFACLPAAQTTKFAYVGVPLRLTLDVSSPDGSPINVTVWWDAKLNSSVWPFAAEPVNRSAVNYSDVPAGSPGATTHLSFEWPYSGLSTNPIVGGKSSYYSVFVNLTGPKGYDPFDYAKPCPPTASPSVATGYCFFRIAVAINTAPALAGVSNAYTIQLLPPEPVIPPFEVEATVQDSDNDAVIVTWIWDDGNVTVNRTGPAGTALYVNVSHTYSFPLNVSPRNFYFHLNVSVDDGRLGHNVTSEVLLYYYVAFDGMPTNLQIVSPDAGSSWEVGATVPIEASFEEPEGEPMLYYFDYGDGNVSTRQAMDHNGTVTSSHAYGVAGEYNLSVWVTDNLTKELCLNLTANCTTTTSHWASIFVPISVYLNRAPVIDLTVSSAPGVAGKSAEFSLATFDRDLDNLTVTWSFGDGTWATNWTGRANESNTLMQAHNYTHWGPPPNYTYTVTVWADDGMGHNVTASTEIFVGSANEPPLVSADLLLTNNTVHANDTFTLRINASDPEGDPIWISVDWGDGNITTRTNDTMLPGVNYTLALTHSYSFLGKYTINVSVTDHMIWVEKNVTGALITVPHDARVGATVTVEAALPPPVSEDWNWVDYVTLTIVLAIPVAAAVRAGYQRHLERRED